MQWQVMMWQILYQMDLLSKMKFGRTQNTTYLNWQMREMFSLKPTQLGDTRTATVLPQMTMKQ